MTKHPGILKNNINHLSKRGPPPFFHSDTNVVLRNVLVHSVEKNPCSGCNRGLIWLLFLNILSFTYVQTTDLSFRFRKFRRSYTYTSLLSFKPTNLKYEKMWNIYSVIYNNYQTVASKHFISRRTTFSLNRNFAEEATFFPFLTPWYGWDWATLQYTSARTQMLYPTRIGLLFFRCLLQQYVK